VWSEWINVFTTSADQVRAAKVSYGAMPLIVLSRAPIAALPNETQAMRDAKNALWMKLHDEIAASSTRGVNRIVPGAGHFIQLEKPESVIEAVYQVLDQGRKTEADQLTPAQMREDLSYLRNTWAPLDKSFSSGTRAAFAAIVDAAAAHIGEMSSADFELEIARAVAASHNGHTLSVLGPAFHRLPLEMEWFADGLYITRVEPAFAQMLGAKIYKIGPLTPEQALARTAPYISGTDQRILAMSPTYLRLLEVLHHIGAAPGTASVEFSMRLRDGTTRVVTVRATESANPDPPWGPWLSLIPADVSEDGQWLQVLDGVAKRPITYQSPVDVSTTWLGDNSRVLYVRSNRIFSPDPTKAFDIPVKFFDILQHDIADRRPQYVIVDLRFNPGGNYLNAAFFAQGLPRLLSASGKVFVLVGRNTFSAAIVTAAMLKGQGGRRVVLVGEGMGDTSAFWAEGGELVLPNSKMIIQYADAFHDLRHGCSNLDRCYWGDVAVGLKAVSLDPQIKIETTFADYAAGHDPVLDRVLSMAN
jgi:hypothetical protein